eukprot:31182-Pelagococcus_subviridis.AAC.12
MGKQSPARPRERATRCATARRGTARAHLSRPREPDLRRRLHRRVDVPHGVFPASLHLPKHREGGGGGGGGGGGRLRRVRVRGDASSRRRSGSSSSSRPRDARGAGLDARRRGGGRHGDGDGDERARARAHVALSPRARLAAHGRRRSRSGFSKTRAAVMSTLAATKADGFYYPPVRPLATLRDVEISRSARAPAQFSPSLRISSRALPPSPPRPMTTGLDPRGRVRVAQKTVQQARQPRQAREQDRQGHPHDPIRDALQRPMPRLRRHHRARRAIQRGEEDHREVPLDTDTLVQDAHVVLRARARDPHGPESERVRRRRGRGPNGRRRRRGDAIRRRRATRIRPRRHDRGRASDARGTGRARGGSVRDAREGRGDGRGAARESGGAEHTRAARDERRPMGRPLRREQSAATRDARAAERDRRERGGSEALRVTGGDDAAAEHGGGSNARAGGVSRER